MPLLCMNPAMDFAAFVHARTSYNDLDFRFLIDPRVQVHSTPTKPEFFRMKLQVCDNPTLLFDETPGYVRCFDETLSF